jgi:hypothetical protein
MLAKTTDYLENKYKAIPDMITPLSYYQNKSEPKKSTNFANIENSLFQSSFLKRVGGVGSQDYRHRIYKKFNHDEIKFNERWA